MNTAFERRVKKLREEYYRKIKEQEKKQKKEEVKEELENKKTKKIRM